MVVKMAILKMAIALSSAFATVAPVYQEEKDNLKVELAEIKEEIEEILPNTELVIQNNNINNFRKTVKGFGKHLEKFAENVVNVTEKFCDNFICEIKADENDSCDVSVCLKCPCRNQEIKAQNDTENTNKKERRGNKKSYNINISVETIE